MGLCDELVDLNCGLTSQVDFITSCWYRKLTKKQSLISYDLVKLITLYSKYTIEIEIYNKKKIEIIQTNNKTTLKRIDGYDRPYNMSANRIVTFTWMKYADLFISKSLPNYFCLKMISPKPKIYFLFLRII